MMLIDVRDSICVVCDLVLPNGISMAATAPDITSCTKCRKKGGREEASSVQFSSVTQSCLTLCNALDCMEIQPVHSKGDQPWVFFGRNDAKAETAVLWPPHVKSRLIGKDFDAGRDWRQEEKGTTG